MARSIDAHAHAHAHHAHAAHHTRDRLARKLAQLDRSLAHAVRDGRLARLSDSDRAAFAANAATDHATIAAVTDALAADGSDVNVSAALAVLDDFGPHAYVVGVLSSGTPSAWPPRSPP